MEKSEMFKDLGTRTEEILKQQEAVAPQPAVTDISDAAVFTLSKADAKKEEPVPQTTTIDLAGEGEKQEKSHAEKAKEWFKALSPEAKPALSQALINLVKPESPKQEEPQPAQEKKAEIAEKAAVAGTGTQKLETVVGLHENKFHPRAGFMAAAPAPSETKEAAEESPSWSLEAKEGDTTAGLVREALEKFPGFHDLGHEGQKIYVVNLVLDDMREHPQDYGLPENGEIGLGTRFNLKKLLYGDTTTVN